MEVRQLPERRPGAEATLWMDPGGDQYSRESGMGAEARIDRSVSHLDGDGAEPDLDRTILCVAEARYRNIRVNYRREKWKRS